MKIYEKDFLRWGKIYNKNLPQLKIIKYKRICETLREKNRILYAIMYFIYNKMKIKYGVDLPVSTKVGEGFKIEHIGGIVINPDVCRCICKF